jgi:hypothetical protein
MLGVYYLVYQKVNAQTDAKTIWVPPKAKPQLPFGLGPAPEPVKPEEFEKTTYKEYEIKTLKENAQQLIMGGAMSYFMALKFNIYISLVVQIITMPLNLYDNVLFKKYIMGVTKKEDGSLLYGEVFSQPTVESIAAAERVRATIAEKKASAESDNKEKSNMTPSVAKSAIPTDEPRVEELSEETAKPVETKKAKSTAAAEVKKDAKDLNEIDE